jgi:phosphoketolase
LTREHIKPRLLGHWGTTTGLNFIYVHLKLDPVGTMAEAAGFARTWGGP